MVLTAIPDCMARSTLISIWYWGKSVLKEVWAYCTSGRALRAAINSWVTLLISVTSAPDLFSKAKDTPAPIPNPDTAGGWKKRIRASLILDAAAKALPIIASILWSGCLARSSKGLRVKKPIPLLLPAPESIPFPVTKVKFSTPGISLRSLLTSRNWLATRSIEAPGIMEASISTKPWSSLGTNPFCKLLFAK